MTSSFSARAMTFLAVVAAATLSIGAASNSSITSALARLKSGNAQFVSRPADALPIDADTRAAVIGAEHPIAAVVTCADAQVPPEVIFHTGLGDLFVVRVAGHVTDRSVLASVEYAIDVLAVPLVVVMGHEMCGAVKTALDTPANQPVGPNLGYLLKALAASTASARSVPERQRLRAAILANVEDTINRMATDSPALRQRAESGAVTLIGAYYESSTGRVHFSEPVALPYGTPASH